MRKKKKKRFEIPVEIKTGKWYFFVKIGSVPVHVARNPIRKKKSDVKGSGTDE